MKRRFFLSLASFTVSMGCAKSDYSPIDFESIGEYTLKKINIIVTTNTEKLNTSSRVILISQYFLGTPYKANKLIGSQNRLEELVIDLRSVDCLSFLEYIVALNHSTSFATFVSALVRIRYINKKISFPYRRHFFTDWYAYKEKIASDITKTLSAHAVSAHKTLNQKFDGTLYLPGISPKERTIFYIPSPHVKECLPRIKDGDLIGIYSPLPGLDVSHTGLAVWKDNNLFFRNASSLKRYECVIDALLEDYLLSKAGIVVLRPM